MTIQNDSMTAASAAADTATSKLDSIKTGAKHLVEQGQEKAGQARDAIVSAKDKVVSTGSDVIATARRAIVDHPFIAIGAAFGVGYVAMRIFRR